MPAINVARTDTFEQQRVKINNIGSQVFQITQGGSDLATGNLKLGNGTLTLPSLSFINDDSLGFYQPELKTLGFVSAEKRIFEYSDAGIDVFSNQDFRRKSLETSGIVISSGGTNYDQGSYEDVILTGGSGVNALADIVVTAYTGVVNSYTPNYTNGTFQNIKLVGGNGTNATVNFTVTGITGTITDAGSGYAQGIYTAPLTTTGSGVNATAEILVGATGSVVGVNIISIGTGYQVGDVLSANDADLGGNGGSGFEYTVDVAGGNIVNFNFTDKGTGYQVGDVLSFPVPITGLSTNLSSEITGLSVVLSTASPTVSVASTAGIIAGMFVTVEAGSTGSMFPGTEVQSVDAVNNTITFNQNPTGDGAATLTLRSQSNLNEATVSTGLNIIDNSFVSVTSGSGQLAANTRITSYDSVSGLLTFDTDATVAGPATLTITPPFGYNTATPWEYTIQAVGVVESVNIVNPGFGYNNGDTLSVSAFDLVQPTTFSVTVNAVTELVLQGTVSSGSILDTDVFEYNPGGLPNPIEFNVVKVVESGGNITSVFIEDSSIAGGDTVTLQRTSTSYTVDTSENSNKYFIDGDITPDLSLYSGNTYIFDYSAVTGHPFNLSAFPDGIHSPSSVSTTATLDQASKTITVADTTGILPGMSVSSTQGDQGEIPANTFVDSVVDSTTFTVTNFPSSSGSSNLEIRGVPYTEGVSSTSNTKTIKVNDNTPTLYYYCEVHSDMAGKDGSEATISIDINNPKIFGSGLAVDVFAVLQSDVIQLDIESGKATVLDFQSTNGQIGDLVVLNSLSSQTFSASTSVTTPTVGAPDQLLFTGTSVKSQNNFLIGNNFTVTSSDGNLVTSGSIRATVGFNSNNKLLIEQDKVKSTLGNNIVLEPYSTSCVSISSTTSLNIPVGTTAERPGPALRANGSIRFNTDTGQYEGYNDSTTSWSSLGGVRDIDGNTYILAELTAGANDNTLWFFNDSSNTLKLTPSFLQFQSVKSISSPRLGLPNYAEWTAQTPVNVGDYIKYRNNLYEVTGAGTTASSGSEPTHTSGVLNNGTAQFTWYSSSVSPLEFTEIEELRVGPNKDCPLIVSAEIKLLSNTISTLVEDLVLSPNSGKKVSIDAPTSLVIPVGNTNQRGSASAGSIRFNTTISQFEGYSGSNWSSLGGVRDVDGNTYIIPETAPAANENILYFYNNNVNTIQLSETELDFTNIDTITTSGGNSLALNTDILTLDSSATTIDNSRADTTFISTSKQYFDLGLSSGLNVDPVLRLDDQGDVYLNIGFGTGSFNGIKIFDGDLKDFELADYAVATKTFDLTKGSTNTSSTVLYSIAAAKGCDVTVISKSSSGKKSMAKYSVIDDGTDIYFTEIGSLNTSADGFTASFDITALNETRISLTLSDDHSNGDVVSFTLVTQTIK